METDQRITEMKFFIAILSLTLFVLSPLDALANNGIDSFVRAEMQTKHIPGAALVVIRNGKIIKSANYGLANVELDVAVNDQTSFEIASMTKQFTAAALLLLVQDGKLRLDDSATTYLADLPSTWRDITIRRLLDHTSGLRDDWDEGNDFFLTKNSDQAFLDALKERPLEFLPGERFSYSCGPFLVGMIISKVSGMSYAEFMRKRIFEPLGMTGTHVNDAMRIVPNRASGYVYRDGTLKNGVRISPAAHARADVGIRTTARDLVKWDAALNDDRLLTSSSLNVMFSPTNLSNGDSVPSGLGWFLYPMRGHEVIQHGGGFRTGFNSTINRYPEAKLTIILLTNLFRAGANDLGHKIAGFYFPEFRPLDSRVKRPDPKPDRTVELRNLIDSVRTLRENVPGLAQTFPYRFYVAGDWNELLDGTTAFTFIDCDELAGRRMIFFGSRMSEICYYRLSEKQSRFVSFLFDHEGKVALINPYEY